LLSLGWPGADDSLRASARKEAETLAKTLREENRGEEADRLLQTLPDAEARDVFARLTWVGEADLDLAVDEPLGATADFNTPRTVFGGSIIKNGYGSHPEEVYVCPRAFDGEYVFRVVTIANSDKNPALQATLEVITHEGTSVEHRETHTIKLGKNPSPTKVKLTGGRRKTALPYILPAILIDAEAEAKAETAKAEAKAKAETAKAAAKPAAPDAKPAPRDGGKPKE
jgi:hypothetical protein